MRNVTTTVSMPRYTKKATYPCRLMRSRRFRLLDSAICPDTEGRFEIFDPIETYLWTPESEKGRRVKEPPYLDFLRLALRLRELAPQPDRLEGPGEPTSAAFPVVSSTNREGKRLILDWCQTNGLLGIIPSLAGEIRLNAIETAPGRFSQLAYTRHYGRWFTHRRQGLQEPLPGGVRTWSFREMAWEEKPLEPWLTGFVQNTAAGPDPVLAEPATEEFWRTYREPVEDFCEWSTGFLHVTELASVATDPRRPSLSGSSGEPIAEAVSLAIRNLEYLAGQVQVSRELPERTGGALGNPRLETELRCPSLLAAFALMVLTDLELGRRIFRCGNCGKLVVSSSSLAAFCREACRKAAFKKQSSRRRVR